MIRCVVIMDAYAHRSVWVARNELLNLPMEPWTISPFPSLLATTPDCTYVDMLFVKRDVAWLGRFIEVQRLAIIVNKTHALCKLGQNQTTTQ